MNKLMEQETKRELQRQTEMKNCPADEKQVLLMKHQKERIKIAHQLDELKKNLK